MGIQTVEGEIGVVIDYSPGKTPALNVLQGAMSMVEALDQLDAVLLSSISTSLEPVSVLNDVQHSSLKMLLARVLRNVPDEAVSSLDWKKWVGGLLIKGKYLLLRHVDSDAPKLQTVLHDLKDDYKAVPGQLVGLEPPSVSDVMTALAGVSKARSTMSGYSVTVETELGDVMLPDTGGTPLPDATLPAREVTNSGTEYFKVKSPDMLGSAQWTVQRNGRGVKVEMLHRGWLDAYHRREFAILPGDSLRCKYEETVVYDQEGNEIERRLAIVEVEEVISPPVQTNLI